MADDVKVIKLEIESPNEAIALLGNGDSNVKVLEEELGISVITRGEAVSVAGDIERVTMGEEILKALLTVVRKGIAISSRDVLYAIELARKGTLEYFGELYDEEIAKTAKGKSIKVKTIGQRYYIQAIKKQDLVFGIGPAGTGKTYLAVVMAINALKNGHVKRIILTRPAVEAGRA